MFKTLQQAPLSAKEFWGQATRLGAWDRFGEWVKVAELVMVMVPGSVEDERMISTFKYIRNPQRNRLHAQHLRSCARGFKSSVFSVESFPYPRAISEWLSAKKRRGIVWTKDSVKRKVLETDFPLQFQNNLIELMQYF